MRKTKPWLLAIAMLCCSLTASAHDFEVNGIYYNITSEEDLTVEVTYSGSHPDPSDYVEDIVIPEFVSYNDKKYRVTSIDSGCFASGAITSVVIPNGVMSIGFQAFWGCSSLTSVTIGSGVTSIGHQVFSDCPALASIVVDSNNPVYDSRDNCNAIIETATNTLAFGCSTTIIPNSVTSIGNDAFFDCGSLTSIEIPNSVTSIGDQAFWGCSSLTSIKIPNSVTSIGVLAFAGCRTLTRIEIPNGVMSIGYLAFSYSSSLTSVTIGSGVTSIGHQVFSDCPALASIVVDSNNPVYDSRDNCNAIIETETNTLIYGCNTTIIPNSVTSIGDYAFSGCSSLTSIEIPNSVTSIGELAFYSCSSLTSINIGSGVERIGDHVFSGCPALASIVVDSNNPVYDSRDNCNAIIETATNTLAFGCSTTIIPNSVTSIGNAAFSGCSSLTSIEIPNSVTSIGESAFVYCSSLTSIEIPNSITSIGEYAF